MFKSPWLPKEDILLRKKRGLNRGLALVYRETLKRLAFVSLFGYNDNCDISNTRKLLSHYNEKLDIGTKRYYFATKKSKKTEYSLEYVENTESK